MLNLVENSNLNESCEKDVNMLKLGRIIHKKNRKKGRVVLINPASNVCFVYFDKGTPYGNYCTIDELKNLRKKKKN